jgi:hypothetical protein
MKRQQIIVLAGCLLVAVMALFPPYLGVALREGENLTRFIGYYCILSPPEPRAVYEKLYGKPFESGPYSRPVESRYTSQIDMQRLAVQVIAILVVTTGLGFALKEPSKPQQAPERDA